MFPHCFMARGIAIVVLPDFDLITISPYPTVSGSLIIISPISFQDIEVCLFPPSQIRPSFDTSNFFFDLLISRTRNGPTTTPANKTLPTIGPQDNPKRTEIDAASTTTTTMGIR